LEWIRGLGMPLASFTISERNNPERSRCDSRAHRTKTVGENFAMEKRMSCQCEL
jgi:hypothetical protein